MFLSCGIICRKTTEKKQAPYTLPILLAYTPP